jgi:hypothetical protein
MRASSGFPVAMIASISAKVRKGSFSSSFGKRRPWPGKVPLISPPWAGQFQQARRMAISFLSVTGAIRYFRRRSTWA